MNTSCVAKNSKRGKKTIELAMPLMIFLMGNPLPLCILHLMHVKTINALISGSLKSLILEEIHGLKKVNKKDKKKKKREE